MIEVWADWRLEVDREWGWGSAHGVAVSWVVSEGDLDMARRREYECLRLEKFSSVSRYFIPETEKYR